MSRKPTTTHGFWSSRKSWEKYKFYQLYLWIKARCNRKTHVWYKNYWWRWIKCERKTFEEFRDDMYESYLEHCDKYWRKNTMIDRIDNNKNYCKENCKWATRKEQNSNTRRTMSLIIDGHKITSVYISELCWIKTDSAYMRIIKYKNGFITKEELFTKWYCKPSISYPKTVLIDWIEYTSTKLANLCWVSTAVARKRMIRYYMWKCNKEALLYKWKK